jgi:hypothetical protein
MMSAQPAGPTFREGDEVVAGQGLISGHFGRFSPHAGGHQLGGHQGTQWCHPNPPGDMAGSFRDPTFHKLTST